MRMPLTILLLKLLAALCHSTVHTSALTPLPTDEHGDYNGSDLIEWIKSHPEGDIHPSLRIGRERPGDPTSMNGLFVSSAPGAKPIKKGDIIAQVAWDHLISPGTKYDTSKFFSCRAIYNIAKELKLGEKSTLAPYVRYLLAQPRGTMPGEWTEAGQEFLANLLGNGELPPYESAWRTDFHSKWIQGCDGHDDDDMERAAYWLSASRDEDTLMIPIYDMANHSNDPKKLNTLSFKPYKKGDNFRFIANKKIMPGEQIFNSYNRCNACSDVPGEDCETVSHSYTPDLFVNFGFVEDYPQSWEFEPDYLHSDDSSDDETEFDFCLERNSETGELDAFWDEDEMPDGADERWLKEQLKRLEQFNEDNGQLETQFVQDDGDNEANSAKMTRWEWESIWRYHQALSRAIDAAIQSVVTEIGNGDEL